MIRVDTAPNAAEMVELKAAGNQPTQQLEGDAVGLPIAARRSDAGVTRDVERTHPKPAASVRLRLDLRHNAIEDRGHALGGGRFGPQNFDGLASLLRANALDVANLVRVPLVLIVPDATDHLVGARDLRSNRRGRYSAFSEQRLAKRLRG